jgi:hypothetical protein
MGGIIGALIGRHLAHTEEQHQAARQLTFAPVASYLRDAASSQYTPEQVDQALEAGMKMNYFPKDFKSVIGPMIEAGKSKWQAARNLEVMNRLQGNPWGAIGGGAGGGQDKGVPTMTPGAPAPAPTPAPAAAAPAPAPPVSIPGMPQPPGAGIVPPAPPPVAFAQPAPVARPPVPGAPPGSAFAGNPLISPLVPFANGVGTGPAPIPGEKPAMQMGSQVSTTGFGGPATGPIPPAPSTAAPAAAPAPAQPAPLKYPDAPPEFWIAGRGPGDIGAAAAAKERPSLEQANQLALQQSDALYQQQLQHRIAEEQRMTNLVQNDPELKKVYDSLNPLQKAEMRLRLMGVQGQMSNYARPTILPHSVIKGDEFPPGSLTVDGNPIDSNRWYTQQQDISNNEVRGIPTTPTLTKTRVLTADGRALLAFTDPRGDIDHVISEADNSPIVDPRMLATVRSALENRTIITVDKSGKPTTSIIQVPVTSKVQKSLPGGRVVAPAAGTGGAAAPATAAPAAPAGAGGGPRVVASFPKPLTAATQRSAEFAQTVQKHVPRIEELINSLENDPKGNQLGVIASRWKDFMAGKVGAGDPRFSALQTNLKMFATALGVAHQTKGIQIMNHFQEMADAGKLNAETLKSNFGELKSWVNTYADMGANRPGAVDAGGAMNNPPAGTPKGRKPLAEYFK